MAISSVTRSSLLGNRAATLHVSPARVTHSALSIFLRLRFRCALESNPSKSSARSIWRSGESEANPSLGLLRGFFMRTTSAPTSILLIHTPGRTLKRSIESSYADGPRDGDGMSDGLTLAIGRSGLLLRLMKGGRVLGFEKGKRSWQNSNLQSPARRT